MNCKFVQSVNKNFMFRFAQSRSSTVVPNQRQFFLPEIFGNNLEIFLVVMTWERALLAS